MVKVKLYLIFVVIAASQLGVFGGDGDDPQSQAAPAAAPTTPTATAASAPTAAGDVDDKKFERYKSEVCNAVPGFTGGEGDTAGGSKWSDVLTESEILELAFVNMAYGLSSDSVSHLKSELGWKKTVIDTISLVTKASCTDMIISEPFLNTAKNLFLYYLVKMQRSRGTSRSSASPNEASGASNTTEGRAGEWNEVIKSLAQCATDVVPIDIITDCGKAVSYSGKDGEEHEIMFTLERFDQEVLEGDLAGVDVIIDTIWWMFSTTYARCYSYFYPNEDIILLFYQMFRDDFLLDFINRWRTAGQLIEHFPIVFGPYDYATSAVNTRRCCSASYQFEGLAERELVRPVIVLVDKVLQRNFKVTM